MLSHPRWILIQLTFILAFGLSACGALSRAKPAPIPLEPTATPILPTATPQAMAHEVLQWLDQPKRVEKLQAGFAQLHETLRRDTAALASHAIQEVLES